MPLPISDINFDHKENTLLFVSICLASVVVGLLVGGAIDAAVRKVQQDDEDWRQRTWMRAAVFFAMQVKINIALLLVLTKSTNLFVPWLQLSVAGALFAVLLFAGQRNMTSNVLRLTNF